MKRLSVVIFLYLFSFNAISSEVLMPHDYVCEAEQAVGFLYSIGEWDISEFSVNKRKYLIRILRENEKHGYFLNSTAGVFLLGEKYPLIGCIYHDGSKKIICKEMF